MNKKVINYTRLGIFVLAGLGFLILLLYMIGKNENLFGSTYELRIHFENVQGLVKGNGVRYAGIDVGTVKSIEIIGDRKIEVTIQIQDKMKPFIKSNVKASIANAGLVGNKVVNLIPVEGEATPAVHQQVLTGTRAPDTDNMLLVVDSTNRELAKLVKGLNKTINRLNQDNAVWDILEDRSSSGQIRETISNLHKTSIQTRQMATRLDHLFSDIQHSKGILNKVIFDNTLTAQLEKEVAVASLILEEIDEAASSLNATINQIDSSLTMPGTLAHFMLRDTVFSAELHETLESADRGITGFEQNMEALKHNFLFRGYFRKQEKQRKKN